MGLFVGGAPVKQVYVGSTPVKAVYVGSKLVWSATVQITLGTGYEARDQLRAALAERGMHYLTVTEIPFDIELVGSGSVREMFRNCVALTHVPDMDTSNVTDADYMFYGCAALTDGNVRLIGRHPQVTTTNMIAGSGLTREPFYTPDGQPWPTAEVHEVSVSGLAGENTAHPLVSVTVPAGETWTVRVQGTMQTTFPSNPGVNPQISIGSSTSSGYANGAAVDYSGTITAANSTIALVTRNQSWAGTAGFAGTVTIEK